MTSRAPLIAEKPTVLWTTKSPYAHKKAIKT
jgi:hypothetical protein